MQLPDRQALAELTGWDAPRGVVSLVLEIDHGDRSQGWKADLRNRLRRLTASDDSAALSATAERVADRLLAGDRPPDGRSLIGFVEVDDQPGREAWYTAQIPPSRSVAVYEPRPYLRPLIEMLDDGEALGVAALSAERVRVWEWQLGRVNEVGSWDWDTEVETESWRDRKGPTQSDPARVQTPSSSGRDLFQRRLNVHRERFLEAVGEHTARDIGQYGWRELLCFGDEAHADAFTDGLGTSIGTRLVSHHVIVHDEAQQISERVESCLPELNRQRELALVQHAKDATFAEGGSGALGAQDTADALIQARVRHLLFDSQLSLEGAWVQGRLVIGATEGEPEPHAIERLIEQALQTDAQITPVEGKAAEALAEHGGIAAILRY